MTMEHWEEFALLFLGNSLISIGWINLSLSIVLAAILTNCRLILGFSIVKVNLTCKRPVETGNQTVFIEWLAEEAIGARIHGPFAYRRLGKCGDENHR